MVFERNPNLNVFVDSSCLFKIPLKFLEVSSSCGYPLFMDRPPGLGVQADLPGASDKPIYLNFSGFTDLYDLVLYHNCYYWSLSFSCNPFSFIFCLHSTLWESLHLPSSTWPEVSVCYYKGHSALTLATDYPVLLVAPRSYAFLMLLGSTPTIIHVYLFIISCFGLRTFQTAGHYRGSHTADPLGGP